jgi:hypothetical protein
MNFLKKPGVAIVNREGIELIASLSLIVLVEFEFTDAFMNSYRDLILLGAVTSVSVHGSGMNRLDRFRQFLAFIGEIASTS